MHKQLWVGLILCASASSALAAPACNQQMTRGSWVATCEGTLPTPSPTPTRILGTCDTSKSAYWTCEAKVNLGGQIIPQTLQGQAYNNADCTGFISYTQTLNGQPAGTLDIDYVISEGGNAINGLPLNSGGVLACSLKRISNGSSD
jgi:hypothetical protein